MLRTAISFAALTLLLLPGGFRAFMQVDTGWEAWSFARFISLTAITAHLILCWLPLALKYFRRGTCRDVPAFAISSMTLYVQLFICYALFHSYARWQGLLS